MFLYSLMLYVAKNVNTLKSYYVELNIFTGNLFLGAEGHAWVLVGCVSHSSGFPCGARALEYVWASVAVACELSSVWCTGLVS